jgi:SulP family sulfate permease
MSIPRNPRAHKRTVQQPVFSPKLFTVLKGYTLSTFTRDAVAGVIVGVVALPLAIAFAIASGVTPDRGLITAVIAGFIISFLGGSRVQIGGPTGAFVVIVYGIVHQFGVEGLLIATVIAGLLLISMGLLRLGSVIKFIPYPLTVGFTAGIAVVIFSSQVKDFFGLNIASVPAEFHQKWVVYFQNIHSIDVKTLLLSLFSMGILLLWPRINRRIPGSMVAIIVVTVVVRLLDIPVETIGSRFGDLPSGFPKLQIPSMDFSTIKNLISPAVTIALLGAIESLLSATVADGMIEGRHRSNTELIAQGVANVVTPFFGGIPATGAIARTATNVKNGAQTPVAGIIHAITLLAIVMLFGQWAKAIPLCVLAAILVIISYHMSEWHSFKALLQAPKMDVAVMVITFTLTVLVDLTVAVEVGLVLSVILFMKRMTDVSSIRQITGPSDYAEDEETLRNDPNSTTRKSIPQGVRVFEAEGALFFGVAELFRDILDIEGTDAKILILRMRHVLALDATGLRALSDLSKKCSQRRITLILSGVHSQPRFAVERSGFLEKIGKENVLASFDEAIQRAEHLIAKGL